jgi:hypothetical protein
MMQGMGGMVGACLGGRGGMMAFMGTFWVAAIAGIVYAARRVARAPVDHGGCPGQRGGRCRAGDLARPLRARGA